MYIGVHGRKGLDLLNICCKKAVIVCIRRRVVAAVDRLTVCGSVAEVALPDYLCVCNVCRDIQVESVICSFLQCDQGQQSCRAWDTVANSVRTACGQCGKVPAQETPTALPQVSSGRRAGVDASTAS